MIDSTLAEISRALENRDISSVEITKAYLDRIAQENADLNAFITVTEDLAMAQAEAADKKTQ